MLKQSVSAILFLFFCGLFLIGITAETAQNKELAASKCLAYTNLLKLNCEKPVTTEPNQDDELPEVGGHVARDGEYPHMALLGFQNEDKDYVWLCGGTLISERYVLTVAHCVSSPIYGAPQKVRLGLINQNGSNPDLQEFNVEKIIKHENYSKRSKHHDIALIKLDQNVRITKEVRPACLFTEETKQSTNVVGTGWGSEHTKGKLRKVELKIQSNELCQASFKEHMNNQTMLCVGHLPGGRDMCKGDAGGPLVISKESNPCTDYVVGLTSYGRGCGLPNQPAVYTKVSAYTDWIVEKIW